MARKVHKYIYVPVRPRLYTRFLSIEQLIGTVSQEKFGPGRRLIKLSRSNRCICLEQWAAGVHSDVVGSPFAVTRVVDERRKRTRDNKTNTGVRHSVSLRSGFPLIRALTTSRRRQKKMYAVRSRCIAVYIFRMPHGLEIARYRKCMYRGLL